MSDPTYQLRPVGWVDSPLADRAAAPKQGDEGAPLARVTFRPELREAARDLREGDELIILTWLHLERVMFSPYTHAATQTDPVKVCSRLGRPIVPTQSGCTPS